MGEYAVMITKQEFISRVVTQAKTLGYKIETNRNGQRQIDFGIKKLHEGHLAALYPGILEENANISRLIDLVAPGRPCSHKPMKTIIASITKKATS